MTKRMNVRPAVGNGAGIRKQTGQRLAPAGDFYAEHSNAVLARDDRQRTDRPWLALTRVVEGGRTHWVDDPKEREQEGVAAPEHRTRTAAPSFEGTPQAKAPGDSAATSRRSISGGPGGQVGGHTASNSAPSPE